MIHPMRFSLKGLLLLTLLLALALPAPAELYTWVDAQGVKHIDSNPPPKGVRALNVEGKTAGGEAERRFPKVEIYLTGWCPSCKMAKAYLQANRIPFTAYDVDHNATAAKRLMQLNPARTIPTAVIGDVKIIGFNQATYEKALGLRK